MSYPRKKTLIESTFRKTGSKKTGDLFDQGLRGQECIVFLGKFLDKLLVLVKSGEMKSEIILEQVRRYSLFQIIDRLVFEFNLLGAINVRCISKNADGHPRAGYVRQPEIGSVMACHARRAVRT